MQGTYITSFVCLLQVFSNGVHCTVASLVDAAILAIGTVFSLQAVLHHEAWLELSIAILQAHAPDQPGTFPSWSCRATRLARLHIAYKLTHGIAAPCKLLQHLCGVCCRACNCSTHLCTSDMLVRTHTNRPFPTGN